MRVYDRAVHGAEAGAIAAGAVEVSYFVLDLIRLEPFATPAVLSGASLGPGGGALDLTSLSGVFAGAWGAYQIVTFTFMHVAAFAAVGILASLLFDWSRPGRFGRLAFLALLCTAAFSGVVTVSSSMVAIDSVGSGLLLGMSLLGASILYGGLRLVSTPDVEETPES